MNKSKNTILDERNNKRRHKYTIDTTTRDSGLDTLVLPNKMSEIRYKYNNNNTRHVDDHKNVPFYYGYYSSKWSKHSDNSMCMIIHR